LFGFLETTGSELQFLLLLKQRTSQLIFFLSDFYEFLRRNE